MPVKGKISEYFDFDNLNEEKKKVKDVIAEFIADINKGANIKISLEGATKAGDIAKGYDNMAAAAQRATAASQQVAESQKKIAAIVTKADIESRVAKQELTASLKQEVIATKAAEGSYNLLNAQLKTLSAQYRALSAAERDSAAGKDLQKDILEKNTQLKALDESMGNHQRNVGNYSSALTGYANTLRGLRGPTKLLGEALGIGAQEADQFRLVIEHAIQGLAAFFRGKEAKAAADTGAAAAATADTIATEANNVATAQNTATTATNATTTAAGAVVVEGAAVAQTELAVATAASSGAMRIFKIAVASTGIGLLLVGIGYLVYKIIEYRKQMEEANAITKLFAEVNADAAKEAGKEVGSLKVVRAEIENTTISMEKRLQAIKNLKDEYPELLKNTTDEALLQGKAAAAYDLVAASILKKAQAQAAEAKIQELVSANLDIMLKNDAKADEVNKKIRNAKDDQAIASGGSAGLGGNFGGVSKQAKQKAYLEEYNDQKAQNEKLVQLNNDKINALLKLAAVSENIETDKTKKEKTVAVTKESLKELLDAKYESDKIDLQRQIKLLDEEEKNDKNSYEKRISFLNQASTAKLALIDLEEKQELKKNAEKEVALQDNLKKSKGTERNNILRDLQNTEAERTIIQKKAANERLNVFDENEKQFNDLAKHANEDYLKGQKSKYERALQLIEDAGHNQKAALDKQYSEAGAGLQARYDAGEISLKNFNKKKADLDFAYGVESLKIEIDTAKKKLAVNALLPVDKAKALESLAALEKKLQDDILAHTKKTEAEKLAAMTKTLNEVQKTATDVFALIDGLLNAQEIAQKNRLKDQSDAAEKKAARDIEIVNASTLSEQDKAAKITVINARLAAQKQQIALKEKAAELERLKFQKAQTIFNIILTTTLAVIKAYSEGDPFTKVARAILAGAAGAAQLAIAIATPIPKYKHGTNFHPGGPAILGDGFKKELWQAPDGTSGVSPDKPTLMNLPAGTKVFPDANKLDRTMMAKVAAQHLATVPRVNEKDGITMDGLDKTMHLGFTSVVNAVKNQPRIKINGRSGYDIMFQNGNTEVKYLNDNLH
ncbi:hypothetical protein QWZ08_25005 [Ferruginibacter paludis]|uniref:hypothetical protein n=1 Tax=Ferruginibacter paludis TaxID=1310417 RepID=UPI0025B624EF|nr:hypothetical protein [Ferruginibacter paludis]MDN3658927.1 hypothetical protein [Ferruginibacter paludis]